MMKKHFYFLLMATLVCGLSLSVTSCKDDDKNDNNGGTDTGMVEDGISEEDAQAWSWVSIMTDETTQETGWQNKSYDVTIGQQSDNDQSARLIIVSNLDDAKANFSTIAGCAPEELNTTKTVSAGSYGSMTWNISEPSAPNIATVEVKSPLLKTTKLIYCTEEPRRRSSSTAPKSSRPTMPLTSLATATTAWATSLRTRTDSTGCACNPRSSARSLMIATG